MIHILVSEKNWSKTDVIESLVKTILKVFEDKGFAQAIFCDL